MSRRSHWQFPELRERGERERGREGGGKERERERERERGREGGRERERNELLHNSGSNIEILPFHNSKTLPSLTALSSLQTLVIESVLKSQVIVLCA